MYMFYTKDVHVLVKRCTCFTQKMYIFCKIEPEEFILWYCDGEKRVWGGWFCGYRDY